MKKILLFLLGFTALTSIASGTLLMVRPDGSLIQMSTALLSGTGFSDFFIPGLVLCVAVGGSSLLAWWLVVRSATTSLNWSMLAGTLLAGWIVVQYLLIRTFHPLQPFCFLVGLMIVLIGYQLKGKWAV